MSYVIKPAEPVSVPVTGSQDLFGVHRIYCVGKNYAAHVREMGSDPAREAPCFFLKPADAIVNNGRMPYPPGTRNLHYEGELVIALGKGGTNIPAGSALEHVFGYAMGLDMTRRDLQTAAGQRGQPWDTGKAFDFSAPLSPITPVVECGHFATGPIRLWVNDGIRQDADLAELIWTIPEIIAEISRLYTLMPGDLIFTGTPAGVGAVVAGDRIRLSIASLGEMELLIV